MKKVIVITTALCILALAGFTGFGIYRTKTTQATFETGGFVLRGEELEQENIDFGADTVYSISRAGNVSFLNAKGQREKVDSNSFFFLNDNSVIALSDGVLLDFNDLSENFINNYYITAALPISGSDGVYTAETTSGTITFGENLWKLNDSKYLVQGSGLKISFGGDDVREVGDFVQVTTNQDGIVFLLTAENFWATISPECYIETEDSIRIYPIDQLVDNGTYKLSLAKLSVNPDDSIVLTADETRRQIVPELNLEGVDGEDGVDGEAGTDGQIGTNGTNGKLGEKGESGEDGEKGTDGTTGASGTNGSNGTDGSAGSSGSNGGSGRNGVNGNSGGGGADGGTGPKGNDAQVQSSTNTVIPTMSFTDWNVTATGLSGTIYINDPSELFSQVNTAGSTTSRAASDYDATITIYDETTGDTIHCYPSDATDTTASYGFSNSNDIQDKRSVSFKTLDATPLKPDTCYRLSVVAYYGANDMIYSREFINRIFYTNSTGVYMANEPDTVNGVSLNVSVSDTYQSAVKIVTIYLLTPDQNATFSPTATNASSNCVQYCVLNYENHTISYLSPNGAVKVEDGTIDGADYVVTGLDFNQVVTFGGAGLKSEFQLSPDTAYVARAVVTTTEIAQTMTREELSLRTLKATPTWSGRPTAYYNRITGAFEVYRPEVVDPHGGVIRYIFTPYTLDSEGKPVEISNNSKVVQPNDTDGTPFYLPSGVEYVFGVTMEFNDNEKQITYNLGISDIVLSVGDTMPKVTLDITSSGTSSSGTEYDSMHGQLKIDLSGTSTAILVNSTKPLQLQIYADQVYGQTISITKIGNEGKVEKTDGSDLLYSAELMKVKDSTSNEAVVNLTLEHLMKNTSYTITVSAYVTLGEHGSENKDEYYTLRTLGTVSFRTYDTVGIVAQWTTGSDSSAAINRVLQLEAQATDAGAAQAVLDQRDAYATNNLKAGQVTLTLSRGTGPSRQRLSTVTLNTQAELTALYGNGLEVTERLFGTTLAASTAYTLEVTQVADRTYSMNAVNYINEFEVVTGRTEVVTSVAQPPDLISEPTNGVRVTRIYNEDATDYGGFYDDTLPDDAVVGYLLNAQYDNAQRLGVSVTYYAFEYNTFFTTLITSRTDPVKEAMKDMENATVTCLKPLTYPIPASSDDVPGVVVFFGNTRITNSNYHMDTGSFYNGNYVYYAPEALLTNSDLKGMGRGFRYLFAYTVEYSNSSNSESQGENVSQGSTATYPYSARDYEGYKNTYGAGTQYGKSLGKQIAYIFNSGMVEEPKLAPEFHTYVYETVAGGWDNSTGTCEGTLTLHYAYRDQDETIVTGESDNSTKITFQGVSGGMADQFLTKFPVTEPGGEVLPVTWYQISLPYTATYEGGSVDPTVNIALYKIDYTATLTALKSGTAFAGEETDVFYLCHIPVDRAYGKRFGNMPGAVYVDQEAHQEDNYIDFILSDNMSAGMARDMGERAYAMKLTFMVEELPNKEVMLPMTNSGDQFYARMTTGELGEEYLNLSYKVSAEILYDTGDQGWKLVEKQEETPARFALQYINTQLKWDDFQLSNYSVASIVGAGGTPGGALVTQGDGTFSAATLRRLLLANQDAEDSILFRTYGVAASWTTTRYVYPVQWGVCASGNPGMDNLSQRYLVPKGVATYALTFVPNKDTGMITSITPSVTGVEDHLARASHSVAISDFTVSSFSSMKQTDGTYKVYARLYSNREAAETLKNSGYSTREVVMTLDSAGKPTTTETFTGLDAETSYYLAVFMLNKDGQPQLLLDKETAQKAVYEVYTSSGVRITSSEGLVYRNEGYFQKTLTLRYLLNRITVDRVEHTLYRVDSDVSETLIYTEQQMKDLNMFTAPAYPVTTNDMKIDMTPALRRKDLVPGATYRIKLVAYEGTTEVGSAQFDVKLPPVTNYGALIYVNEATSSSITFQVSMNDVGYSFMGSNNYAGGAGLYAVRFTDEDGTWIPTKYDKQVFSTNAAQQEFTLKQENVTSGFQLYFTRGEGANQTSTRYTLNVYAVVDINHDGLSELVAVSDTEGKDWKYFFEDAASGESTMFSNFLRTFWQENAVDATRGYPNEESMDSIERKFLVASRDQTWTDENGLLVDAAKAVISRRDAKTIQLVLQESFGVVVEKQDDVTLTTYMDQTFDHVTWQVDGFTNSGNTIKLGDTTTLTNDGPYRFEQVASNGFNMYTLAIPAEVSNGSYTVIVQLYKNAGDLSPYKTISLTFFG